MTHTTQHIGRYIRNLRQERQLTQKELANFTGVSRNTIQRYENGNSDVPSYFLETIENLFDMPFSPSCEPPGPTDIGEELKTIVNELQEIKKCMRQVIEKYR